MKGDELGRCETSEEMFSCLDDVGRKLRRACGQQSGSCTRGRSLR